MAKAKGRQPKVYWAEIDGLNEWIVAAPNRDEALEAFGVRQNLFAQGAAGEEGAPDKVEAARGQPGVPLRRPKSSGEAFAPADGASDWSAAAPKGSKAKPKKTDRKALDAAEARLRQVQDEHCQALAEIAEDRARVDERLERETRRYETDRAKAQAEHDEAEASYRKAGGG
ncbi:MAG: hypothetical protein WDN45_04725 [Caulobacteraceae bacterium]